MENIIEDLTAFQKIVLCMAPFLWWYIQETKKEQNAKIDKVIDTFTGSMTEVGKQVNSLKVEFHTMNLSVNNVMSSMKMQMERNANAEKRADLFQKEIGLVRKDLHDIRDHLTGVQLNREKIKTIMKQMEITEYEGGE